MIGAIYVITDPDAPQPVEQQALAAARGGARLIQIRDKYSSDDDLAALVTSLLPRIAALGARLIVNDRVDVALRTCAHGIHIGQRDGDVAAIRRLMPDSMFLGLSVETVEQARHIPRGVNYVGAGPIRPTATKPDHVAPIGIDGLAAIIAAGRLPTYAIGGLKYGDAAAIRATGAVGMAVVSAVVRAPNLQAATAALVLEWAAS